MRDSKTRLHSKDNIYVLFPFSNGKTRQEKGAQGEQLRLKPGGSIARQDMVLSQSFNQYEVMDSVLRSSRSSLLVGNKPEATAEKAGERREGKAEVEEEEMAAVAEKGVQEDGGKEHVLKMLVRLYCV